MSVAVRLQQYIADRDIAWDPVLHGKSRCGMDCAHRAHVPPGEVAKAVLLEDAYGYVIAVIPADRRLDVAKVGEALDRELRLAGESEVSSLFPDCEPGALPPLGEAYGVATLWDPSLAEKPDVYFEGGDHRTLVHMSGGAFASLMSAADRLPAAGD